MFQPKVIETEAEYNQARQLLLKLVTKGDRTQEETALLKLVVTLVKDFDEKQETPEPASLQEVLLFLMEENAVKHSEIQVVLQIREGGERGVETPTGFVDLVTDEWVIEIKHVKDWKDGAKVLIYALNFPNRKPRVHLFGGYSKNFRSMVEETFKQLSIAVTWEREAY